MNIQNVLLAKRYAASYMRSGGGDYAKKKDDITEAAKEIAPYLKHLSHPCIFEQVKFEILDKVMLPKFRNSHVENFLKILVDSKRISLLGEILREIGNFYNEVKGIVELDVYSRFELSEGECAALEKVFAAATGKKIILKKNLKPELIGGLQVQFNDFFVDNSVKTRLDGIRKTFLN